jgi:aspartate carbamoyltransferase catalytic subunit
VKHGVIQPHLLDVDTFSEEDFNLIFSIANKMKPLYVGGPKKSPILKGKTIATLFYEPSTRTRISFETAGKMLSADIINLSVDNSSSKKGESFFDTMLTLQSTNIDLVVIRHNHSGAPYMAAKYLNKTLVINAGDGSHAHPTQALADMFTLTQHLETLKNKKVLIVGDVAHSRVARSNLLALRILGANPIISGPPNLIPWDLFENQNKTSKLFNPFSQVTINTDLDEAIIDADVVMALRLQSERHARGLLPSLREYANLWQVTSNRLEKASPNVLLMHPGPMNIGVEVSPEVAYSTNSVVQEQVSNSIAIRMAILLLMTGKSEVLNE